MTRCDYDAVFYRVFCITLLAIAFTFTVILTNVFIDIDGLLANKKDRHNGRLSNIIRDEFTSEATENEELNYGENDDSYRTKRSIETQSYLFHIKNPKVKNILANRLSTLLEELDAEESSDNKLKEKKNNKEVTKDKDIDVPDIIKIDDKKMNNLKEDEMLHLTMHNILLQGIIGHMDLHDVYERVYALMSGHNDKKDNLYTEAPMSGKNDKKVTEEPKAHEDNKLAKPIEERFFEEILNCNELQEQISRALAVRDEPKKPEPPKENPNILIKTVIDIKSLGNEANKENDTKIAKDNIKGVIELIYNGKIIKFTRPDLQIQLPDQKLLAKLKKVSIETTTTKPNIDYKNIPKSYLDKFVEEYFKRFPHDINVIKENYETKRLKRHVKIKYDETSQEKKKKNKTQEDELYVEIETHFDSKGMKGEKKKKLIRSLIEKIQKAIHSDMDGKLLPKNEDKTKKQKQLHFKKRLQNPLDHKNHVLVNKYSVPLTGIIHRQLNPISKTSPISKTVPMQESSPYIGGKSGEEWKKPCFGPGFLAAGKAINSAEMSEVDVDYTKVLDMNGIPQRMQKPLNTEISEESVNSNSFYDVGKMKFFIKDIDGSGFSVGFNQYVDEPPDSETMKLFTGLENVIKTYHQNYDATVDVVPTTAANPIDVEEKPRDISANNERQTDHIVVRRSINQKHDYHSNEYKIIFDNNFLPYNNYRDIFETKKSRSNFEFSTNNHIHNMPLIVDENIFEKKLKPAEIFGLANLFDREKRSVNVKKISNLKGKIKLNRYLNTKAMSTKRIFLNKKRNKRQINKIRIIATDLPHLTKHSDENVFVVSDENVFADRAIVKEVETSEGDHDHDKQEDSEYIPYQAEENLPPSYVSKLFDSRSRHNPLMSKYPHIFMEEISRSREEYIPDNALLFGKLPGLGKLNPGPIEVEKPEEKVVENVSSPAVPNVTELPRVLKEQEIVNALMAPPAKANYKVTVKIVPKNGTGLNSGFKEIHTSINKRFNKNGLLYSSLVNVSEISKVVKLNRSKEGEFKHGTETSLAKKIRDQQEKMQYLLKQHAKHINEQLSRLNEEKTNLETMLDNDNLTDIRYLDYDDIIIPSKTKETHTNKQESTKVEDNTPVVQATTTTTRKPHEETTKTSIVTTIQQPHYHYSMPPPMFTDRIKKNIISTIERNGNLTDQILRKIDKNTEILQLFLKKLTEKIQTTSQKPVEVKEDDKPKFDMNSFPPEWANQGMNFNQNMVIRKNDSHISIPFVYAYQQPIIPHKTNTPVASVVYHGHIHTNAIHAKDQSAEKEKVKLVHKIPDINNQSRFFIDELENDYKVIQVGDVKKSRDYNMVTGNGTLV